MRQTVFIFSLSLCSHTHAFSFRETVSADFLAACHLLKDHMDNMDNPNEDMVSILPQTHSIKPKEVDVFNILSTLQFPLSSTEHVCIFQLIV